MLGFMQTRGELDNICPPTISDFPSQPPGQIIDTLERRIGTNSSKRSFGKSASVHQLATEDKCDSSSAYLSRCVYHQPIPESQKSRNLLRTTPGRQNLALERRNRPNPSDRRIGTPMRAHTTATEDKCDSSWAYSSSYIYHQPLPESQKSRNLLRTTPGRQNLALGR